MLLNVYNNGNNIMHNALICSIKLIIRLRNCARTKNTVILLLLHFIINRGTHTMFLD